MKKHLWVIILTSFLLLFCYISFSSAQSPKRIPKSSTPKIAPPESIPDQPKAGKTKISKEGADCLKCHSKISRSFVREWELSAHAKNGVDCYTCHQAEETAPDALKHYGYTVHILVTPKNCGTCHPRQVKETTGSHHADAGNILDSLDNYLGEVVAGPPAVATGCFQCHGSKIKVLSDGKLDPATWPNTGIGRINPDGSLGSCSACHTRHRFSKAQARQPEACGKCHLGPDHPQREVYEESKHGILYYAKKNEMNLDRSQWIVGADYTVAATCATCHMGATPNQPATHDVGARISWTLRPPISKKLPDPEKKRAAMVDVCSSCHAQPFILGFYEQFDNLVDLYNTKFAGPATSIRKELMDRGLLTKSDFDAPLHWIYYELWHHEGRRARHGASMSGPDYAWWHGMYDVAKNFYQQFMPEVKRIAGPDVYKQLTDKYLSQDIRHEWYLKGMSKEDIEKIRKYYEQRYGEAVQ